MKRSLPGIPYSIRKYTGYLVLIYIITNLVRIKKMNTYKQLFLKNLDALKKEISLYKNEEDVWKISGDMKNTPGNLCLHICGNLNHFFGAELGKTGYIRERDLEFSRQNVSREELITGIENTKK